jgi:ABC-2 type transport system permease protein
MLFRIACLEWSRLLLTPKAWILLASSQGLLGWILRRLTQNHLELSSSAPQVSAGVWLEIIQPFFAWSLLFMILLIPLLGMQTFIVQGNPSLFRLWSSFPLRSWTWVGGQCLGILGVLLAYLASIALLLVPIIQSNMVDLEFLLTAFAGLFCLAFCFSSFALLASSITKHPTLASLGSFLASILFLLSPWLRYSSPIADSFRFFQGQLYWQDLCWYALFSFTALSLATGFLSYKRRHVS